MFGSREKLVYRVEDPLLQRVIYFHRLQAAKFIFEFKKLWFQGHRR